VVKLLTVALLATVATIATVTAIPARASPRGTNGQIVFDRADPDSSFGKSLYVVDAEGSNERELPRDTCCAGWSSDGSKLAIPYLTADGRIGTGTINADGSGYNAFPIQDPSLNVPCGRWSPDDAQLLCHVMCRAGRRTDGRLSSLRTRRRPAATSTRSTPTAAASPSSPMTVATTTPTGASTRHPSR
jgi:hypothetical protein